MEISDKDKESIAKEIEKNLQNDNRVAKALIDNKDKIKKAGFDIKSTVFINPETGEKTFGGCIEIYESESKNKILDGISIDIGTDSNLKDIMLGLSKNINFGKDGEKKEFSIGGYIDVIDTTKIIKNTIENKKNDKNISVKIGISKEF